MFIMLKKILIVPIVLLFLLAAFIEDFHSHEDFLEHDDCPICIAVMTFDSYLPEFDLIDIINPPLQFEIIIVYDDNNLKLRSIFRNYSLRAPPAA